LGPIVVFALIIAPVLIIAVTAAVTTAVTTAVTSDDLISRAFARFLAPSNPTGISTFNLYPPLVLSLLAPSRLLRNKKNEEEKKKKKKK
jgi:hypothetical protein